MSVGRQIQAGRDSSDVHLDVHLNVESIEYCLEVSSPSDSSPLSQSSSPELATPVRAGPSPGGTNRQELTLNPNLSADPSSLRMLMTL